MFTEITWNVLDEVHQERLRQETKWGEQNHLPSFWITILGEEYGETCRAILEKDSINYREELIQVAAVTVAMIESFDRNKKLG